MNTVNGSTPLGSSITALLGPTNTGKTHRCVGRMLEYETGMLGLPLRLLAREVYDRVCGEVGSDRVALVTGEERRVPKSANYWICTTEAMPTQLEVDFVGVDEVQLASSPTRGHVFTDRILHTRGRFETWFLGASTIEPVLRDLVPTARFLSATRLSKLNFTGAAHLGKLPNRSAVVAFSVPQVYELAEQLRVRKGGVAVVLGALSPRTRNAQVAMYQSGEVDHLVATDAIGMGLNMSIAHVALSAVHKFDGRQRRGLSSAELAQIAGRAGRSIHDGSFGTLQPLHLDPRLALDIEHHRFPAVRHAIWRSRDLDFSSLNALNNSLLSPPKHPRLKLVQRADDSQALALLSRSARTRARVRSETQVQLLWEVCQIPDYRKLLPEIHAELLFTLFEQLETTGCQLDDDWIEQRFKPLDTVDGDLDALLGRIAFVRTWSYVVQRADWVRQAKHWQHRAGALEDRLSDALHQRLVTRFVQRTRNRRTSAGGAAGTSVARPRRTAELGSVDPHSVAAGVTASAFDAEPDPNHPFAGLSALRARLRPAEPEPRHGSHDALQHTANDAVWQVHADGSLTCAQQRVAQLRAGSAVNTPDISVTCDTHGTDRSRLHQRCLEAVRDQISTLLSDLDTDVDTPSPVRGICYQLRSNLGGVEQQAVAMLLGELTPEQRIELKRRGIVVGRRWVYVRRLLKPTALHLRYALTQVFFGPAAVPHAPPEHRTTLPAPPQGTAAARYLGFAAAGPVWVRCDLVERAALALTQGANAQALSPLLGCKRKDVGRVLDALGFASQIKPQRIPTQPSENRRKRRRRLRPEALSAGRVKTSKPLACT